MFGELRLKHLTSRSKNSRARPAEGLSVNSYTCSVEHPLEHVRRSGWWEIMVLKGASWQGLAVFVGTMPPGTALGELLTSGGCSDAAESEFFYTRSGRNRSLVGS